MKWALILLCATATAHADSIGDARQLASSAQAHFDLGEYGAAAADYRAAYRLVPSPGLLYDLGQTYRLMGDCPNARTMYKSYLRRAPRSPYRELVLQHLSSLGTCLRVSTIGGAPPPLLPPRVDLDEPARVEPRHHRLWVGIATAVVGLAAGAAVYWYEEGSSLSAPAPMPGKGAMGWRF